MPKFTGSTHKPTWLLQVTLATLTLSIIALPASASSPQAQPPQALQVPNATCPAGGQCFADVPSTNPFYAFINRIYQQDLVTGYSCGGIGEPCDPESRPYYRPVNNVTRQQMAKFIDNARRLPEIRLEGNSGSALIQANNSGDGAILGISTSGTGIYGSSGSGYGVYGFSNSSYAVVGEGPNYGVQGVGGSTGVTGSSTSGTGVSGSSTSGWGVFGISTYNYGVRGQSLSGNGVSGYSATGQAGHFDGNVQVTGNLSKGGGSFKIDDPLDPANKYLYHSFVESPDMMNVYNGNVTTDDTGEAVVTLPAYFETLNRDFRYQLTTIGQHADSWIAREIDGNQFTIQTDEPNVKVSWQVTGIRQDPYANAHRIPVEEDKPTNEKGKYLHPTEWGQPESAGVDYEEQQRMQQATQSTP